MKTIRCKLTKACQTFTTFTDSLCKNMGILPLRFKEVSSFYQRIIRSSISLVYARRIKFVSILT